VSRARQRPLAILRPVVRPAAAAALGLTLVLGAPLLAGCGTGQLTQTAAQVSAVDGAQGQVGPIAVRNVMLAFPESGENYQRGGDAPLKAVIVNTGLSEDELTSVRSPAAEMVQTQGQRALQPQLTLYAMPPSQGTQTGDTEVGARRLITIALVNLAEDIKPGRTVPVTFLFRQAGELTLDVPIGPPQQTGASATPTS
jgi:periplasmic copper chaperone A